MKRRILMLSTAIILTVFVGIAFANRYTERVKLKRATDQTLYMSSLNPGKNNIDDGSMAYPAGTPVYSANVNVRNASDLNWALVIEQLGRGRDLTVNWEVSLDGGQNWYVPVDENNIEIGGTLIDSATTDKYIAFTGVRASDVRFSALANGSDASATIEFIYQVAD